MREKPILVIMAAGMGSRYGGLKQIDPVGRNGEIILDYSRLQPVRCPPRRVRDRRLYHQARDRGAVQGRRGCPRFAGRV